MTYPSLGNLPTDILVLIFGQFCLHCQDEYNQPWDVPPLQYRPARQKPDEKSWYSLDRQALVSLSLASRRFRDIAQSILYHEFVLGYDDSWRTDLYTWDGRLISFMRTLRQRRDLARLVKVVYVHPRLLWAINVDRPRDVLGEAAETLGIDLAEIWKSRIPCPEIDDWAEKLEPRERFLTPVAYGPDYLPVGQSCHVRTRRTQRSWVAAELVAMLIAQLPNVEYLGLQRCSRWTTEGVPASALAALNISSLPVRRLDIGPQPDDVLRLSPGLETLNLHATGFRGQCPPLPNLKILRMTECWTMKKHLEDILHACTTGLKTFAYESRPPTRACSAGRRRNMHFQPSDVVRLLSFHQMTLESLHLDLSAQGRAVCKIEDGLHLKDFAVLEHLCIGSEMIYGFDEMQDESIPHSEALIRLLPASLVSLSIQTKQMGETGWPMLEKGLVRLAELKQRQPDQFPKLRWVQCELGSGTGWLSSMFEAVNVQFTSSSWSLSKAKPYLNGTSWTVDRIVGFTYIDEFSEDELFVPSRQEEVED
ncbi:hypothetical protein CEP54_005044 [Fusarium duplospermum]|uniref:Uncharacterized protein n=1 Tax=Fusarium duplospermum TaxID=1325734 RepID=A0A428QEY5_9HYPO|nr:hypothetical protein CEP54_005044 [Fusarium duplospermum]